MRDLVPCDHCQRHIEAGQACPFCAASPSSGRAIRRFVGTITRAAVFAGAAACWTDKAPASPDGTGFATAPDATGRAGGTLTYQNGLPAAGIELWLIPADGAHAPTTVKSGPDGSYGVALPPGRYRIEVKYSPSPGTPALTGAVEVVRGGSVAADFVLSSTPTRDPNSLPMPYGAPPGRRRIV